MLRKRKFSKLKQRTKLKPQKVFGVGLPRTGTSSLSEALTILGYKTKHYPKYIIKANEFDALVDSPVSNCFEYLDHCYAGAKFILTVRDQEKWLKSCEAASKKFKWNLLDPTARCGPEVYKTHIDIFNTLSYNRDKFIEGYMKHYIRFTSYFRNKNNYLLFDIRDGWPQLCHFLDKPIPDCEFPHRNRLASIDKNHSAE